MQNWRPILAALAMLVGFDPSVQAETAVPAPVAGATLQSVLLLSRHGMRGWTEAVNCDLNGTPSTACANALGRDPWPTLGVSAGNLTMAGAERATTLGQFYRELYGSYNLLPKVGCPTSANVAFLSDTYERTMVTAGSVMNGMFAGCLLNSLAVFPDIYTVPSSNSGSGASCTVSSEFQQQQTAALLNNKPWTYYLQNQLAQPLRSMSRIVGPLHDDMCTSYQLGKNCTLADLPTTGSPPAAIQILGQPTEQLIMQYGSGLPASQVGWGRVTDSLFQTMPDALRNVNAIHAFYDWSQNYPFGVAQLEGSQVLNAVMQNLSGQAAQSVPSFVFMASHDLLMLNVAGMLGLSWQLDSYQPNQVPPGSAIAIELWQTGSSPATLNVRLVFFAQTIEQLHANTPLSLKQPPAFQIMPIKNCTNGPGQTCPWTDFSQIATKAINNNCVNGGTYTPPSANSP